MKADPKNLFTRRSLPASAKAMAGKGESGLPQTPKIPNENHPKIPNENHLINQMKTTPKSKLRSITPLANSQNAE